MTEHRDVLSVASLGGGHGLHQTLLAAREIAGAQLGDGCSPETCRVNAIVTVADDGGSSGRLRRELSIVPPGDLRMAMAALTPPTEEGAVWKKVLQHRFGGNGAMAGHAVGNLMIAGMTESSDDIQLALDTVGSWTDSTGRVLPVALQPLDIEAEVAGLDDDFRVLRAVRGQVAVATTPGSVRRVRLIPEEPAANPAAIDAIMSADVVTIGPGSWFSSVIPHLLVPEIVEALRNTPAKVVVILNLSPEQGETPGFTTERHIHVFNQHAPELKVDYFLADSNIQLSPGERSYLERAAEGAGAAITFADMCERDEENQCTNRHDPEKLAAAITSLLRGN
ncbi:uridine diphosphate-N-acetylglucosamine-binding protein YvcK [Corynebacterium sp. CCUG 69979]|uniref:gluconeogenesis factor YvcK family protein n=1 Tax=Corynebacterium sp. CCUG 69979 TaxID=2823890 RepID=UPI00210E9D5F|nr:uridine diphosphate-N-acetylglucosamine-binding protein YvcK [Corynebacterium sp. CCUG 69979]MCQ4625279.1 uridine diphosphate-N-acetylglucosamine-binding protein YvcK [Corynebacterium sp. CCUG 69979]